MSKGMLSGCCDFDDDMTTEVDYGHGIPDRLSVLRGSPYYVGGGPQIGVKLDGIEQQHAIEFCVSGGWVEVAKPDADGRVSVRAAQDAKKQAGVVETYWKVQPSRQVRRQLARMS